MKPSLIPPVRTLHSLGNETHSISVVKGIRTRTAQLEQQIRVLVGHIPNVPRVLAVTVQPIVEVSTNSLAFSEWATIFRSAILNPLLEFFEELF